jgi:DNA-binding MarR family transcriptional regulator
MRARISNPGQVHPLRWQASSSTGLLQPLDNAYDGWHANQMKIKGKTAGDDLNFYSLLGVLQSGMWLQSDFENYLGQFKLSHGRFTILLYLTDSGMHGLIGNDLAALLGVAKSTIAKMVQKLIDEEYITSTSERSDRRIKKYSLTRKAQVLLQKIIPGYLLRLRVMNANLTEAEKKTLIDILSKINFLAPKRILIHMNGKNISDKAYEIKTLCRKGSPEDIDHVMSYLDATADLPTTKIIDFYLGTVNSLEGIKRIEYYLFKGTQMQRNYCTLFFARRNEWRIVKNAYEMGLIDYIQAYAR